MRTAFWLLMWSGTALGFLISLAGADPCDEVTNYVAWLYGRSWPLLALGALIGLLADLAWRGAERWMGLRRRFSTAGLMLAFVLAVQMYDFWALEAARNLTR
jgi:hypothetical protein